MKKRKITLMLLTFLLVNAVYSQKIAIVGDTMSEFTLPALFGKQISLSDFRGKNVMLVFPRGKVSDHWCQICHYQYMEFAELELYERIQGKYNLQIIFILPYNRESVEKWVKIIPDQMKVIEGWKNPSNAEKMTEGERNWMNRSRILFPKKFEIDSTNIPTPFPILIDAERDLSMSLGIFTTFWDYSYVEQNISSVFLIDKKGVLQFKYISQNTFDRPSPQYLFNFIGKMMND